MTTLPNRPNTGKARAGGVPVVWVQHSSGELPTGSDTWQLVPEYWQYQAAPGRTAAVRRTDDVSFTSD